MTTGTKRGLRHVTDTKDALNALDADGAVIVDDFIPADLVARLNTDLDGVIESTAPGSQSENAAWQFFHGANTKRFTRLAARSPSFPDLLSHPTLRGVADELLLPSCGQYWLNTGQMMIIGPGEPAQFLHRDQDNWPLFGASFGTAGPELTVSAIVALVDFTDECGATRVVPGSHRWDDYFAMAEPDDTVPAEMAAGSAIVYTGKVIHGGGANRTTDVWRRGLHLSFVLGWLTPEEANPLSTPWDVARHLPEDVQSLVGWGSYDPAPHIGGRLWTVDFEDMRTTLLSTLQ